MKHIFDVVAGLAVLLKHKNAVLDCIRKIVEREVKLGKRTHHTVRRNTAQLAFFDGNAGRQLGIIKRNGN